MLKLLTLYSSLLLSSVEQGFSSVQDAILRQLRDDDLTVVEAAISLNGLTEMIDSLDLYEALKYVLKRGIDILYSSEFGLYNLGHLCYSLTPSSRKM